MDAAENHSSEYLLEELARIPGQLEPLQRAIAHFRERQREYVLALVLRTDLPLAEIARVAGLHRLTVSRWIREQNDEISRKNES
jgi:DNA-directed RNA polymerase specialized sigma24 family protein